MTEHPLDPVRTTGAGATYEAAGVSIDADSLAYISLDQLVEATTVPMTSLCRACFDGVYPIELPDPEHLGKHLLELEPTPTGHPDGLSASLAGGGAGDALERP